MSAYNNYQTWTNEMMDVEELPAFSGPLDPNSGCEGAEAGVRSGQNAAGNLPITTLSEDQGLSLGYLSAVPDNVLGSFSANDDSAGTLRSKLNEPWNLGVDYPSVIGMDMGMNMNLSLDQFLASPYLPADGHPDLAIDYRLQGPQDMDMSSMTYPEPFGLINDAPLPLSGYFAPPAVPAHPYGFMTAHVINPAISSLPAGAAPGQFVCTQLGCLVTFKRETDRIRHEAGVHGINRPLYLCQIYGCNKSHGAGYTRKDKLVEHMWKKHANLGFVKRT